MFLQILIPNDNHVVKDKEHIKSFEQDIDTMFNWAWFVFLPRLIR